jgi:hypothetical protein
MFWRKVELGTGLGVTAGIEGSFLVNWEVETYFSTCPSRRSRVLIWDRKSGSCVVGV